MIARAARSEGSAFCGSVDERREGKKKPALYTTGLARPPRTARIRIWMLFIEKTLGSLQR